MQSHSLEKKNTQTYQMANNPSKESHNKNYMEEEVISLAVVMVPLPAQGHLNQLLHLSHLISAYNIPVHFVGTALHNRQAKIRVHGWNPLATICMNFHDFPTPSFDNPPPNPKASVDFPSHIISSLRSSTNLRQPVYALIQKLSAKARRLVVIHDSMMHYVVQDIYSIPNVESYCFQSISAFSLFSFYWEAAGKPDLPQEVEIVKQVPSMEGCFTEEFTELAELQIKAQKSHSGDIYNTSRVIEGLYLDLVSKHKCTGTEKNWAIGPFNPVSISEEKHYSVSHCSRDKCLDWLDKQGLNSVLFISFGTTSCLSDEQIFELAVGLERSEEKFIWVLRDADKGNVFEGDIRRVPLPAKYEERMKGKGLIVRDWAPQLEILAHPSTGGFMSHCGWSSCIESISMGVPIAAWPMHSDQPRNAVLITKVLKMGVELKDWNRRDELVSSVTVENGVRRLMASEEGDEIRKKAAELRNGIKLSLMEGRGVCKEMDSFIAHITR